MIILINPPNPPGKVSNKDMMAGLGQLYERDGVMVPPIDIPYIAACLREKNIPVKITDCLGLQYDKDALLEEVRNVVSIDGCRIIAIRTSLPTYPYDMKIAQLLKDDIGAQIVMFGPYVALTPKEVITHDFIDGVVVGEPEYTFVHLYLKGMKETEGVWFKDQNGTIIENRPRKKISALDQLPFPAWELMPYNKYVLPEQQFPESGPFLPILSSRGCPFACHYCPYPVIQGKKWRARSAENVVAEIEYIVKRLGVKNILFRDPEFTLDRERVIKICRKLMYQKLEFFWRCETRIDTLDEELIVTMSKAGCRGINLGVETNDPETAQKVGRRICDRKKMFAVIDCCKKNAVNLFCFFIIGLPGQDKSEIMRMVDLAKAMDPEEVQFTFATPYPGTLLYQWAEENNFIMDRNITHYTGYYPVMRNENLSVRSLKKMHVFAHHALYMRKCLKEYRIKKHGFIQRIIESIKETIVWFEKMLVMGIGK